MWFKSKPKNRRIGRDFVLDVKLRSSQVRAARTRMAVVAGGVLFFTVFGLYLLWRCGNWALDHYVYENKSFAIQEVDLQTDGVMSTNQLKLWAGVRAGQNLISLDLGRVKRDLEMISMVQSASVEKILPRTLRIRVVEREPIAQVNVPRPRPGGGIDLGVFYLDADGYVVLPLRAEQRAPGAAAQAPDQFPIISGLNPGDLQPGRRIDLPQLQAALQLVVAFEHSPMAGVVDMQRIDVASPETLTVLTGQGSEVTFGLKDLEQQLYRWRSIHDSGQKIGRVVAFLDLAVSNNIPARWLEASAVPSATPKPPKIFHSKKKHV